MFVVFQKGKNLKIYDDKKYEYMIFFLNCCFVMTRNYVTKIFVKMFIEFKIMSVH